MKVRKLLSLSLSSFFFLFLSFLSLSLFLLSSFVFFPLGHNTGDHFPFYFSFFLGSSLFFVTVPRLIRAEEGDRD